MRNRVWECGEHVLLHNTTYDNKCVFIFDCGWGTWETPCLTLKLIGATYDYVSIYRKKVKFWATQHTW